MDSTRPFPSSGLCPCGRVNRIEIELGQRLRLAEQISLTEIDAERTNHVELSIGFDAFGGGDQIQRPRQLHDRRNDRLGFRLVEKIEELPRQIRNGDAKTLQSEGRPALTVGFRPLPQTTPYVFDICYQNSSDTVPDTITGDMHSVNKANFGILHWFGMRFAP